ncbi:Schizosaccharomyces specific protein [Schizosaccharomyces osmophilus]|uniref:Schizosaccharomyces specific protein n=1 Tax=Schizosaccharomyces osmophilus TaxID=2545709 RepID=A0AAE9WBK9_9SCHI|nr:Schizosaccharomyces specific protein [Schizosaccharomyces osmophilus]WBW72237.1 Schizosaccharomyces specific protein [Schizosaccharomyces osmophilus]
MSYRRVPNKDLIPSISAPPFDPNDLKKSSVDTIPRVPVDDLKLPDPIEWSTINDLKKPYQEWKSKKEKEQSETLHRVAPGYSSSAPLLSTQTELSTKEFKTS